MKKLTKSHQVLTMIYNIIYQINKNVCIWNAKNLISNTIKKTKYNNIIKKLTKLLTLIML